MTLAVLYGELNLQRLKSRVGLFLAAVLLALVANWIRVFIIIYMGYETNMTSSLIEDHDMFGWWVFAASLVPLFFFARRLEKHDVAAAETGQTGRSGSSPLAVNSRMPLAGAAGSVFPLLYIGLISWMAMPPGAGSDASASRQHNVALVEPESWMPLFEKTLSSWQPSMENPDRLLKKTFLSREGLDGKGGSDEQLFVALYSYNFQRPGGEVVHYRNRLYDSSAQLPERTFTIAADDSLPLAGLTLRFRRSEERIHLAYGYYVEGRWETNDLQAKLAQLPGLLNARTDASLLVIGLQCEDCDAEQRLEELTPEIQGKALDYLDGLYGVRG